MNSPGIKSILQNHRLSSKSLWIRIYLLLTVGLFVFRVAVFASHYGGIEHDSGWIFGVAKNLAHRGIYASYTNTVLEQSVGVNPSIHRRFSVQDENGFCHFPSNGFSIGPGYVVPEAILIKILGDGWWQYRLWPLLSYACFLFLLFYLVWRLGGICALVLMQLWLWVVPQLTVTLGYESFSEHIGLFFLMSSFLLCSRAKVSQKRLLWMFLAGCLLSLAVLTKLLLILTSVSFMLVMFWELYQRQERIRSILVGWAAFATGFVLPRAIFELYRFSSLVTNFGLEGWQANNEDFRRLFVHDGSGVSSLDRFHWSFIYDKLKVWSHVGIDPFWVPWIIFLASPLLLLKSRQEKNWRLIVLIYGSAVIMFSWFVFISPTGWGHHAWYGLLLSMMLISIGLGATLAGRMQHLTKQNMFIVLWLLALIGLMARFDKMEIKPFLDEQTIWKWNVSRENGKGFPHVPIFSLADQKETMNFFGESIQQQDRVYYVGWFLVAEMSPLVDKVFYPLGRYLNNDQKNPDGGRSYLILGPYQQGRWRKVPDWYQGVAIVKFCEDVLFANESYTVCALKKNVAN